jgi:hypothetical protein
LDTLLYRVRKLHKKLQGFCISQLYFATQQFNNNTMKSILFVLFSGLITLISGFTFVNQPTSFRLAQTSLEGSRNRDKIASRTKWLEKRGFGDAGVATLEKEEVEAEAESADEAEEAEEEAEGEAKAVE